MNHFDVYTHNGDDELIASLGLKTHDVSDKRWSDLGTVVLIEAEDKHFETATPPGPHHCPATTVKVEVCSMPAQFWRFTVTRPREELDDDLDGPWKPVYEPVEVYEVATGSGGFCDYWPAIKLLAEHCL